MRAIFVPRMRAIFVPRMRHTGNREYVRQTPREVDLIVIAMNNYTNDGFVLFVVTETT